ncbi:MAG: hypothetical protein IKF90_11745 [Parasporobacterium sp.]|nr:hypothetical protein [Parasporobacterium sp.]
MAGKTVAVYDNSESYIKSFLKYVSRRKESWMEIKGFTETDALEGFLSSRPVDLLLFSMEELVDEKENLESRYEKFISHKNVKEFVYFGERRNSKSRIRHVNKYQSAKKILAEIQEILLPEDEEEEDSEKNAEKQVSLIGVYDPAQEGASVRAALEIAEELSVQKETLFLDFDRFPLVAAITGSEPSGTISDLIYYYKTNSRKLKEGLEEKCQHLGTLDYLTGPEDREDMFEIPEKEWPAFLRKLAFSGGYAAVVVHMGEAFSDLMSFFDSCSEVFLPVYSDNVSIQKHFLMSQYLYSKGRKDLFEKIQYLNEPSL